MDLHARPVVTSLFNRDLHDQVDGDRVAVVGGGWARVDRARKEVRSRRERAPGRRDVAHSVLTLEDGDTERKLARPDACS
jgi:hypothetical protein